MRRGPMTHTLEDGETAGVGADFLPARAKYHVPVERADFVLRPRLTNRLAASSHKPVVLLTAGAGYGKSTVASQWTRSDPRPFAWVAIDESDNEPVAFMRSISRALGGIQRLSDELTNELDSRNPALAPVVMPLISDAMSACSPFVLVLDDIGRIKAPEVLGWLERCIASLPAESQIALVGREVPRIRLARMRLEDRLEEIQAEDLAMSAREAEMLLERADLHLRKTEIANVIMRTEGWAAGLHLATLALRQRGSKGSSPESFDGSEWRVADYLRDELLSRLPEDVVTFLIETSILEELSGQLCDAVLETKGNGQRLRWLEKSKNMFLIPLDRRGRWYRYHHLFAQLLRSELDAREGKAAAVLHQRASRWYEDHGEITRAVSHARQAGDFDRAGGLVLGHFLEFAARGQNGTVGLWLEAFSDGDASRSVPLALARAWFDVGLGRVPAAERWIATAEAGHWSGPLPDGSPNLESAIAILRAMVGSDGLQALAGHADSVRALGPNGSAWYPVACSLHASACLFMGDLEVASELLPRAERASRGVPAVHVASLAFLGLLATENEDWDRAAMLADQAMAELTANGLQEFRPNLLAYALSALMSARAADDASALKLAGKALDLLGSGNDFTTRGRIAALVLLGEMELLLGDQASAAAFARDADAGLRNETEAHLLRDRVDRLTKVLENSPTHHRTTRPILTPAEMRVLALLPTHLGLGEIAKAIYLSRNTVKTHAIAIYRKLGVSARGPAVERARSLGYLDG